MQLMFTSKILNQGTKLKTTVVYFITSKFYIIPYLKLHLLVHLYCFVCQCTFKTHNILFHSLTECIRIPINHDFKINTIHLCSVHNMLLSIITLHYVSQVMNKKTFTKKLYNGTALRTWLWSQ